MREPEIEEPEAGDIEAALDERLAGIGDAEEREGVLRRAIVAFVEANPEAEILDLIDDEATEIGREGEGSGGVTRASPARCYE